MTSIIKKFLVLYIILIIIYGFGFIVKTYQQFREGKIHSGVMYLIEAVVSSINNLDSTVYNLGTKIVSNKADDFQIVQWGFSASLEILIILATIFLISDLIKMILKGVGRYVLTVFFVLFWFIIFAYLTHNFQGLRIIPTVLSKLSHLNITKKISTKIKY